MDTTTYEMREQDYIEIDFLQEIVTISLYSSDLKGILQVEIDSIEHSKG